MRKRLMFVIMALALAFTGAPAAMAAPLDTADGWARERIAEAIEKGFVPTEIQNDYTNVITRLEFCTMAVKWMEFALDRSIEALLEENKASRNPAAFSDTSDTDILAAYALGIISGEVAPTTTTPGVFNPGGSFTRQQAAVMVTNTCSAIGASVLNPPASDFADMDQAASWAVSGINFAQANGIMTGVTASPPYRFNPKGTFTRQESILLFNNINPESLPTGSGTSPNTAAIPGGGGEFRVSGVTEYDFTPNRSGVWVFRTSDCGDQDPYIELFDASGALMVCGDDSWDSGPSNNSLMYANLKAGTSYKLVAREFNENVTVTGYTLAVSLVDTIPAGGADIDVADIIGFAFTPDRTGYWNIRTSSSGGCDPFLTIYSVFSNSVELAQINDDGGDGEDAIMATFLAAGETYFIEALAWENGGRFSLSISPPIVLSGNGETVRVKGPTGYILTPAVSGEWEFKIADYGIFDPYLVVYNSLGDYIAHAEAQDDESHESISEGEVIFLSLSLAAGSKYFIYAGEYYEDFELPACSFDLAVAIAAKG